MKRSVPFEHFKEGEYIYFDVARLAELEERMGESIVGLFRKNVTSIKLCVNGILVGLKHHYPTAKPSEIMDLIQEHFDKGGCIDDIATPIIKAIMDTGIFGGKTAERKNDEKME